MTATLTSTGVTFNDSTSQATAYVGGRGCVAYYGSVSGSSIVWNSNGSATFTVPTGITAVKVTAVGGGGAGGGASGQNSTAGCGGGGGYAVGYITGLTPGATIAVTIGGGGVSAIGSTVAGGTSSFGAYISATGGGGGVATTTSNATGAGGAGGTASGTYNFSIDGGAGTSGAQNPISTANTSQKRGGNLGGSKQIAITIGGWGCGSGTGYMQYEKGLLGGYNGASSDGAGAGGAASGYGNGGGGGFRGSGPQWLGGNGTPGLVMIEW